VSSTSARHRKPPRFSSGSTSSRASQHARHRKPSLIASALRSRPVQIGLVATVGAAVIAVPAAQAVRHLPGSAARPVALYQAGSAAAGRRLRGRTTHASPSASASRSPQATPAPSTPAPSRSAPSSPAPATSTAAPPATQPATGTAVYRNPLRDVSDLIPERVDQGVDFGGSGPVYALGNAVITSATADSAGWPGGGWITYQLTDGPAAGLEVYLAEDVQPAVSAGQQVTSSTVIANMFNGGDGIETGWAQPGGASSESQLPAAGGINGAGPFPTEVGLNFEALLQTLGAPAAPNAGQAGNGLLPPGYPTSWAAALEP
jgi:hypothetical protein